jgi:hypothetical protein
MQIVKVIKSHDFMALMYHTVVMKNPHNFHVPLPNKVYQALRTEAEQRKQPATTLARVAIETWLKEQERVARRQAVAAYAKKVAGTKDDLDTDLEASSLETWKALPFCLAHFHSTH